MYNLQQGEIITYVCGTKLNIGKVLEIFDNGNISIIEYKHVGSISQIIMIYESISNIKKVNKLEVFDYFNDIVINESKGNHSKIRKCQHRIEKIKKVITKPDSLFETTGLMDKYRQLLQDDINKLEETIDLLQKEIDYFKRYHYERMMRFIGEKSL